MPTLARLRSLVLPASIALLAVVATGWYNLVWLPSEHKYLDDRNFRLLSTLSEEISTSINTFDKMMDNAADSGVAGIKSGVAGDDDTDLGDYLKQVAPRLENLDSEDRLVLGTDYGDPPNIAVRADEGKHFLYFAFQRFKDGIKARYAVRTDLGQLVRGLLPPANRNPFDVILVAQRDGTVIFQSASPGLAVTKIDAFEEESPAASAGKAESPTPKTDKPETTDVKALSPSKRFSSNKFSEIKLAGTPYRLYSQPLQLSFSVNHPEWKAKEGVVGSRPPEKWVVCGLVRAEAFRSESESISYTYFLWFSAAVLLALLAPPFLKLFTSSPAERLRTKEVAVTAVFACAVAATATFMLLDVYHWRNNFDEKAKQQMHDIAETIDSNFMAEQRAAFQQLADFAGEEELIAALHSPEISSKTLPKLIKKKNDICDPQSACRAQILLNDDSAQSPSAYPYLEFASWSDWKGYQRVKWTTKERITPFINLDDGSIPYYPAIKSAFNDPGGPGAAPTSGVGSDYSPNTGENLTIFWRLMTADGEWVTQDTNAEARKDAFCASLVTRPISVAGPVLPAEFQFAVVDSDGKVIFHSDATRNLRENFFAETDEDQEIRSQVMMRGEGALTANYMGRGHRLYIHPMRANANAPWSVIVFRDLRFEQTMNLEVLSLASILFLFYASAVAIVAGLTIWAQKGRGSGRWLWPDSRKAAAYQQLVIINGAGILLLLSLSEIPMKLALLFFALCIPVGVLMWNLMALKKETDRTSLDDAEKAKRPSHWQMGYAGTCATLLAVVAVLPCLSFFKVAWDFENKLFIERNQLRLVDDMNARKQLLRSSYKGVDLGVYANQLFAEPIGQELGMKSYQKGFLETETRSAEEFEVTELAHCSLGRAGGAELCVELFLAAISPPYNQIAADGRSLAAASSDTWRWTATSWADKKFLQLQRQEGEYEASVTKSELAALHVPWGGWQWWVGCAAFFAALFWLMRTGLGRVFLLDLDVGSEEPAGFDHPAAQFDSATLIANLPKNLVVIGRMASPIIERLLKREDVQAYDLSQPLNVPLRRAATSGGGSSGVGAASDPVDDIVRKGRPVVFYNFENGLEGREHSQLKLDILERVLSRLPHRVVIASKVDPAANSSSAEADQWKTMLRSFVRIDLNSNPSPNAGETPDQFERRISADAYNRWQFSGRSRAQKLALVQLAQERVVNPNGRTVVHELMKDGLVVRRWGMLTIKDSRFAHFLKNAIPIKSIKHWEKQGARLHSDTLRTSLLVAGMAVAGFLLYTQGAIFNTWITYMTGLAAAVPAMMKLLATFRRGGEAATQ